MPNNWYVITGGPATGKTSLIEELDKLGHLTIPEAARTVIDNAMDKGISVQELRADEKRFQDEVTRLKERIETEHDADALTFFDRGMHDTLAYLRHYDFPIDGWIHELMGRSKYRKVFLLDPLPKYKSDYARTEDINFRDNINQLLYDAYTEHGMEPIRVPVIGLENRVKFIMEIVNQQKTQK